VFTLKAFEFNEKFYQQTSDVAMGTKMGPNHADYFLTVHRRFRDDIFIFSNSNKENILYFITALSTMHPEIKLEFQHKDLLPYLDVLVKCGDTKLITTAYYNPTDSPFYLPYSSDHPEATRKAIPFF